MKTKNFSGLTRLVICLVAVLGFSAGASAQTKTTRVALEPIELPKLDAGRVSAKVNERPAVVSPAAIEEDRSGGQITIKVTPGAGPAYYLTEKSPVPRTFRRDSEQLHVPVWQLFKF